MAIPQEEIKRNVVDQLYWDTRIDASDVGVKVDRNKVELTGTVPNYGARYAAEFDTRQIPGVKEVDNNISVLYPSTIEIPVDEDIRERVKNMLAWNPSIDSSKIEISVISGQVRLEGSVDSYWKKLRAEDITTQVAGVVSVENLLSIVPSEQFSDEVIADSIMNSLERSGAVNAEDIDVRVEKGIVTLSGSIPDHMSREIVLKSAEYTAGVIDVIDNLVILSK
jgi:osmotically-inducible protein OsmY